MAALSTFGQLAVTTEVRTAAGLERRTSSRVCCRCIAQLGSREREEGLGYINVQKAKPKENAQTYALPATNLEGPEERNR